jgi:hypothetical protein
MGRLVIWPSPNIGLAKPPATESKPFRLKTILLGNINLTLERNLRC